jgi:predicted dehydrogenase
MRIGIVGCGLIGQKRAAAIGDDEIIIVCDTNLERARALAARTGADAVDDWRKVVDSDIDAIVVATSHDGLAPITLAAVEAHKHVLVEKPAARSLPELLLVRDAARRRGVSVKAGYNHRFHPGLMAAKRIVSDHFITSAAVMVTGGGRATSRNGVATAPFQAVASSSTRALI